MSETIFLIGHSTRPVEKFLKILEAHSIGTLVDIRTVPKSRHNPQFNSDALKDSLAGAGIKYVHMKELGGFRHPSKDSVNTGWRNLSFRGFADYMQTDEFEAAIDKLIRLGKKRIVAIMCAEGNPFRCHRSLVADGLTVRRVRAVEIGSQKSGKLHELTPFAEVQGHRITYIEAGLSAS
ncbi:MAG TPA: DUF488 domain-containing protein [Nitrososphaerales archaeon]|nr:DUF488 domain-containing protein [Nitrososphaerales archaeon]